MLKKLHLRKSLFILFFVHIAFAKTQPAANLTALNAIETMISQVGDACVEDKSVLKDVDVANKIIETTLWYWSKVPSEHFETAASLSCFEKVQPLLFKTQLEKIPAELREQIKNDMVKAKKVNKEGNS